MPPSPTTIPTSFVPKQPVRSGSPYAKSGGNTFFIVALIVLGVSVVSSVGVFGFEQYLKSVRDAKAEEVRMAQESLSTDTVEEFIRTRNRFIAAGSLLESHTATTGFFELLETLTLENVRFSTLSFEIGEDGSAKIAMDGTARTFNALAAQSSAFAGEKRIKRAIFSEIALNTQNDTVTFTLTAELDPKLLAFSNRPVPNTGIPEDIEPAPTEDTSADQLEPTESVPAEAETTAPAPAEPTPPAL